MIDIRMYEAFGTGGRGQPIWCSHERADPRAAGHADPQHEVAIRGSIPQQLQQQSVIGAQNVNRNPPT